MVPRNRRAEKYHETHGRLHRLLERPVPASQPRRLVAGPQRTGGIIRYQPAMLVVGGLFDAEDCFGAQNVYKALRKQSPATNSHLVLWPWYHGQWASN